MNGYNLHALKKKTKIQFGFKNLKRDFPCTNLGGKWHINMETIVLCQTVRMVWACTCMEAQD